MQPRSWLSYGRGMAESLKPAVNVWAHTNVLGSGSATLVGYRIGEEQERSKAQLCKLCDSTHSR